MSPKEFTKKWFENIDGHKFDELEKMLDEKHRFANPLSPEPLDKKGHMEMLRMVTSSFGEHEHILNQIINDGEWVSVHGYLKAKHIGEFNGVPATGKKIKFSWIDMQHIVNGKIVEEYFELNPMSIMQQIGAAPVNN